VLLSALRFYGYLMEFNSKRCIHLHRFREFKIPPSNSLIMCLITCSTKQEMPVVLVPPLAYSKRGSPTSPKKKKKKRYPKNLLSPLKAPKQLNNREESEILKE
jgi:hypothetical protein